MRRRLANRFKEATSPFRIVIVRDMGLTGFDGPCVHSIYADKPMQCHGLMQAIALVNRVLTPSLPPLGRASPNAAHCLSRTLRRARLCDKPGGLVVDYLGLAGRLKSALSIYTESGVQGNATLDTAQAIAVLLENYGIACDLMHGFNWDKWTSGKPAERLARIPAGQLGKIPCHPRGICVIHGA